MELERVKEQELRRALGMCHKLHCEPVIAAISDVITSVTPPTGQGLLRPAQLLVHGWCSINDKCNYNN